MAEEIRTEENVTIEQEISEMCGSAEELYQKACADLLPEGDELAEEDLELVAGGMGYVEAVRIVTNAYYQLCIKKKKKSPYSDKKLYEAVHKLDGAMKAAPKYLWEIFKWGVEYLKNH